MAGWWERCIRSWWVKHQGSISGLCLHKFTGAVCRRPPTSEDMPLSGSYIRRRKKSKSTSRAMLTAQGSICGLSPQIHRQSSQSTVDRREVKTAAVEILRWLNPKVSGQCWQINKHLCSPDPELTYDDTIETHPPSQQTSLVCLSLSYNSTF